VCCRQYTNDYKLETYLKVARLYLEDEDPVQAEAYINRASLLQAESTREDLQIHYKASCTQDDHLSRKLGNVRKFDSGQESVREREKSCLLPTLFGATSMFSRLLRASCHLS